MIPVPSIDDRSYQELLDEALARIPVHNPEWTNFNKSDPGVTLLELFAFMTETLLYRANLIPERNRRKFLSLLGVGLQPGAASQGLVSVQNLKGPLEVRQVTANNEFLAGQVPFRSGRPLEVLPLEARVYYKRPVILDEAAQPALADLYASFFGGGTTRALPYQTASLDPSGATAVSQAVTLGVNTVDGALWLALLLRPQDRPAQTTPLDWANKRALVAELISGKVLSLGFVPDVQDSAVNLGLLGTAERRSALQLALPDVEGGAAAARYRPLNEVTPLEDVLTRPGVLEVVLPAAKLLDTWHDLDPLEAGVGNLPPMLDDPQDEVRVLTWVRIGASRNTSARFSWVGINALAVSQETWIYGERLTNGTGEPDQSVSLSQAPVLMQTLQLTVTPKVGNAAALWKRVDDLQSADAEVPVPDLRQPPRTLFAGQTRSLQNEVFSLDPATGTVMFGDGFHGKRPPDGAQLRADYAVSLGAAGNVERGQIKAILGSNSDLKVSNPVRTWGGAAPQTIESAERTVPLFLQHRDRLVNAHDFAVVTRQTPGVEVGRVEVLPAYNPDLSSSVTGDAPGAVTLMLIPQRDPAQPDAPLPDRLFMDAVCAYLEPRRLITTEVFLRPPAYVPVWVSVGLEVVAGVAFATVRDAVRVAVRAFLSPLPSAPETVGQSETVGGWPLGKPVLTGELLTEVSRVSGVRLVNALLLGRPGQGPLNAVNLSGLQLPRLMGLSVVQGDAVPLADMQGVTSQVASLPVPYTPQECP